MFLYVKAQFTSIYSLLRGTGTGIDLHQLGKPEVHDVYAPSKSYTATVHKTVNNPGEPRWQGVGQLSHQQYVVA